MNNLIINPNLKKNTKLLIKQINILYSLIDNNISYNNFVIFYNNTFQTYHVKI